MGLAGVLCPHLAGVEDQLRLLRSFDGMLTAGDMPEYLFHRIHGIVGLLRRLIEDGCARAITTGEERLTPELLAGTAIRLGSLDDLDADVGEVPQIPQEAQPPKPQQKKKPRRPAHQQLTGTVGEHGLEADVADRGRNPPHSLRHCYASTTLATRASRSPTRSTATSSPLPGTAPAPPSTTPTTPAAVKPPRTTAC